MLLLYPSAKKKGRLTKVFTTDVFTISGRGTVATGRIERGTIKKGDDVELIGFNKDPIKTTVTGLETFKKALDEAQAGDNAGILLRSVKKDDVKRGMVIAKPGTVSAHTKVRVNP